MVAATIPQLLKTLLPVTARVVGIRSVAGAVEVLGAGDAEGVGATGFPVTALDAAPSPWALIAKSFTW